MNASRVDQLLEAAQWLRLSGDLAGAGKLYEQVLQLDPYNPVARDFLSGHDASTVPPLDPGSRSTNPFQRVDPAEKAATAASHSEWMSLSWGDQVGPKLSPASGFYGPASSTMETRPELPAVAPTPAPTAMFASPTPAPTAMFASPTPAPTSMFASPPGAGNGWGEGTAHVDTPDPSADSSRPHDALDLVAESSFLTTPASPEVAERHRRREEVETLLGGVRDLLELDDHTGAMDLLLKAEAMSPDDPEVVRLKELSERTLLSMFESKLGDLRATPRVVLAQDEIIWLNLDHRAGFVLAQIDGSVTFEDLFALSGMSRFDTARILAQLVEEGVIS